MCTIRPSSRAAALPSATSEAPVVSSGLTFGAAFYAAMHWIAGPALGVKEPEWRVGGRTIGMHAANHLVFGLAVATFARALSRR